MKQSKSKRIVLSIGIRLSLAFMIVILLTAFIGILAAQQFSALTYTTTELSSHDLPEVITLEELRSLLYQQRDLEQNFIAVMSTQTTDISDAQNKVIQQTVSNLTPILKHIDQYRRRFLASEQAEVGSSNSKDRLLLQKVSDNILATSALSQRIQTLIELAQFTQARQLEQNQQEPVLLATIVGVTQLSTSEQQGATTDATEAQLESSRATLFVFALTALCLLLSIVLAIIITRSLTKPLKVLLRTTEAIATGNLEVDPHVMRMDEIGRLATAYDKMRLSLRSMIASLRLERQQTQAIIDTIADGVILVDAECKILKCNPAVERLIGWKASEAINRYCWEVLAYNNAATGDEEMAEQHPIMTALQTTGKSASIEMSITARLGDQRRWLAVSCAPMPVDENIAEQRMVVGLHDISQLKVVEQLKSDFVAMVSHELRAPLTTVTGAVEMLSLLDPAVEHEVYQETLSILQQQSHRLRQVIEEVLQLTRFEAGHLQVHLKPLSIVPFLRSILDNIRLEWVGNGRMLSLCTLQEDLLVWADGGLLEIVIRNLLDNARKYAPPDSSIEVEVEAVIATDRVQVRINDHGPGIPPEQLHHVFEQFSRGTHSSYHWTRGYGLGLYIARELLLAHNGEIWAENRKDGGACFVLSLCAVTDDAHAEAKGEEEEIAR